MTGAKILRGGAFKPRTSPYSFQGSTRRRTSFSWRKRAQRVDCPWSPKSWTRRSSDDRKICGLSSGRNLYGITFRYLKKWAAAGFPCRPKRGFSATIHDLMMSAEYILNEGNPNTALAEDYVRVAFVQDVFCAHDQIMNCCAESALKQHGKPAAAHFFQERKVMHVTSPDLETVRIFFDHRKIARVHHFGDHRQATLCARFRKETKSLFA